MADYYGLLTAIGAAKIANGLVTGQAVELTHMAVGDGGGAPVTPTEDHTALVHEIYRSTPASIHRTDADDAVLEALLVIPPQTGGWFIREVGAFDADGDLILLANWPETYKPVIAEGASNDMALKIQAVVGSPANIELKIDASLQFATQAWVLQQLPGYATTAKAGLVELATDAEARAGADADRAVTPATLSARTATTTRTGLVELATVTEARAGEDATRATTPAGTAAHVSARLAAEHADRRAFTFFMGQL
ncbi:hypothetical protein F1188_20320 [Roseospira marina]|uniref:Phage tail fibre protein N-terminal domain-containing protein n=1 Tax=Roseospira marina TaxID=140057 RepID=A0A5M6I3L7_9PROT|nr:phage tail protein [Roseospira marina]KAA5602796.1 hypothetical protein F1188_20320 [Roseospira marina]MBB4316221.1 phage-related tail fiber protein [Roseospira marina]MBB5089424.1 phage-related tail fiber protein [Roseospira marina]